MNEEEIRQFREQIMKHQQQRRFRHRLHHQHHHHHHLHGEFNEAMMKEAVEGVSSKAEVFRVFFFSYFDCIAFRFTIWKISSCS